MEEYIVAEGGTGELVEKKSRFIAQIEPVESEEQALSFIAERKKKYWDARHNCMAYIVGDTKRFSDDGEPQGTAGKPMLEVLEGRKLTNVVVVVTRYFGGVLLGTGGLVRAYQGAVLEGLNHCVLAKKYSGIRCLIGTDYTGFGKIQYLAETSGVAILHTEYADTVTLQLVCEAERYEGFLKKMTEMTAGKLRVEEAVLVTFYRSEKGITIL